MKRNVIIIGAGDLALDIVQCLETEMNHKYRIHGFLDKNKFDKMKPCSHCCYPILGASIKDLVYPQKYLYVIAVADNEARRIIFDDLKSDGLRTLSIISKHSYIGSNVTILQPTYIGKNAVLNSGVVVKENTVIRDCAYISHGCRIGNNVYISPCAALAGNVIVDNGVFIGINATVIPNKKIGTNSIVAAGAVVIKDVYANEKVAGVPAKEIF